MLGLSQPVPPSFLFILFLTMSCVLILSLLLVLILLLFTVVYICLVITKIYYWQLNADQIVDRYIKNASKRNFGNKNNVTWRGIQLFSHSIMCTEIAVSDIYTQTVHSSFPCLYNCYIEFLLCILVSCVTILVSCFGALAYMFLSRTIESFRGSENGRNWSGTKGQRNC